MSTFSGYFKNNYTAIKRGKGGKTIKILTIIKKKRFNFLDRVTFSLGVQLLSRMKKGPCLAWSKGEYITGQRSQHRLTRIIPLHCCKLDLFHLSRTGAVIVGLLSDSFNDDKLSLFPSFYLEYCYQSHALFLLLKPLFLSNHCRKFAKKIVSPRLCD